MCNNPATKFQVAKLPVPIIKGSNQGWIFSQLTVNLLDIVEDINDDQEEDDQEGHPARHYLATKMRRHVILQYMKNLLLYISSKKFHIRETLNLSTDADYRTNNFFGTDEKKQKKLHVTCDM